jgi:outer membrane receptor for ferrienterochelin and colicin
LNPEHAKPKLSNKARQQKGEYRRKLEEDNKQLKDTILQFEQKIATIQAQNEILSQQLQFFHGHLTSDTIPSGETEKTEQSTALFVERLLNPKSQVFIFSGVKWPVI